MELFTLHAVEVPKRAESFYEWVERQYPLDNVLYPPNLKWGDIVGYLKEAWDAGYERGQEQSG